MKIKDIGITVTGKTPSTKNSDNFDGDISFFTPEDIAKGYVLDQSLRHISEVGFQSIKNNTLDGISILVGCIGSDMGNVALTKSRCATNQQINSITRIKKEINPYYVYYYLSMRKKYLRKLAGSTTTPLLPKSVFEEIEIPLPQKRNQDKIASFLTSIDDKRVLNEKINIQLESMVKTLYDYWFLQFEFPNEDGKPYKSSGGKMVYNEQLKKEIPEGWEVVELGSQIMENEKSSIQVNMVDNKGDIPFFTSGEDVLLCNKKMVTGLNIYMSTGGNATIKIYDGDAAYSTDTWCINNGEYTLFYYLYLMLIKQQINDNYFEGSGLKHLKKDALKKILLYLPNKDILKKYNNVCLSYFKLISKNTLENRELSSLRDFLLPLLMNGQVTIKDAEEKVAEVIKINDKAFGKDENFELWLQNQGLAARGDVDLQTLREIFDAMDEDDK